MICFDKKEISEFQVALVWREKIALCTEMSSRVTFKNLSKQGIDLKVMF